MTRYLVLDTSLLLDALKTRVSELTYLKTNLLTTLLSIFDLLADEEEARYEFQLFDSAYDDILDAIAYGEYWQTEFDKESRYLNLVRLMFGKELYETLRALELYRDGKLVFSYFRMLNDDIVLKETNGPNVKD